MVNNRLHKIQTQQAQRNIDQEGRQPSLPMVMEGAPASDVTGSKPAAKKQTDKNDKSSKSKLLGGH